MTSTSQLHAAHERHLAQITQQGGDIMDYLLDAQEFLKDDDWIGYQQAFITEPPDVEIIDIRTCKDCKGPIVAHGPQGNSGLVCEDCGVVATIGQGWNMSDNLTFQRSRQTKHRIHVYSRLVNYKELLRRMQGNNRCRIKPMDKRILTDKLKGQDATPVTVLEALRDMKLTQKHRRHKERLAWELGYRDLPTLTYQEFRTLCKGFKLYERAWANIKQPHDKRKVFVNYGCINKALCKKYDLPHLDRIPEIKSSVLRGKQHLYISKMDRWLKKQLF